MQAEAVVGRVKKALALHYLTCGMYSRLRSGGLYGILRSCTSTITSCCCPARTWHGELSPPACCSCSSRHVHAYVPTLQMPISGADVS